MYDFRIKLCSVRFFFYTLICFINIFRIYLRMLVSKTISISDDARVVKHQYEGCHFVALGCVDLSVVVC